MLVLPRGAERPLGLKPTDPEELKTMQTKELQNGRLGMIAAAGMIAQELASLEKLFMLSVGGQEAAFDGEAYAKELPGVLPPMGFFDPMGFCSADDITEGKIKFYREVELKHGRGGRLAALGFVVGENFHPLFGGNIDVPAYLAFQQTPLETFWPIVVVAIAIPEIYSVFTFRDPAKENQVLPVGGPGEALSAKQQAEVLFKLLGKEPKTVGVPLALMDGVIGVLDFFAKYFPKLEDIEVIWDDALQSLQKGDIQKAYRRILQSGEAGLSSVHVC